MAVNSSGATVETIFRRLAVLSERTAAAEREIVRRARSRHAVVSARLDQLLVQGKAAAEYRRLVAESAVLASVISSGENRIARFDPEGYTGSAAHPLRARL